MTEKERERNVLEQVRKLIEPTFYCKTALWDALNYAERNIDDDACYNPVEELSKAYADGLKKDAEHGEKLLRVEHERDCLVDNCKAKDAEIEKLGHLLDSKVAECNRLKDERDAMADSLDDCTTIEEENTQEITRLKALLFDYMEKEMNRK